MKKKILLLIFATSLALCTACGKKNETTETTSYKENPSIKETQAETKASGTSSTASAKIEFAYPCQLRYGEQIVNTCDIDNDGKDEKLLLTGRYETTPLVDFSIMKDNNEIYKHEIIESEKFHLLNSVYIVKKDSKNYLLFYYDMSQQNVSEKYELVEVDSTGKTTIIDTKEYSYNMNESGAPLYNKSQIPELLDFYNSFLSYVNGSMLLFDTDQYYYSTFIYSTDSSAKYYADAHKAAGKFIPDDFLIECVNNRLKELGKADYLVDSTLDLDKLLLAYWTACDIDYSAYYNQ